MTQKNLTISAGIVLSAVAISLVGAAMLIPDHSNSSKSATVESAKNIGAKVAGVSTEIPNQKSNQKPVGFQATRLATVGGVLKVAITISNNSTTAMHLSPTLQIFIKDTLGVTYQATLPVGGMFVGGTLQVGKDSSGELDFVVPESASGFTLYYQPDIIPDTLSVGL